MWAGKLGGVALAVASAALHGAVAAAAPSPGARPGDDALSCEQIHAQGMAEAQRDQQERSRRTDAMKAQQAATMGLGAAALLSGGLGGTAQAAQKSAEASADRSVAMLAAPPQVNPRLERLKELSAQKHCTARADVGAGDEAMSCEQIAAELSVRAQRLKPDVQALAQSEQALYTQEREMGEKRKAENQVLGSMWAGAALDPTGMAKRAAQAATAAQQAKERRENEAFANSPQFKQANAQGAQFAAQGAQMQADARLQQLLQLGQQKGCDRNGGAGPR